MTAPHPHQTCVPHPGRSRIATKVGSHKSSVLILTFFFWALSPKPWALAQLTPQLIAAQVDRHYNSLHSLQVNFVQEYAGLGQHLRESGVLLLKKPGRMKWTYSQPQGKLFVLDGHNAYFYAPGQTEVQRVPAKKLDDLRSPLRYLLGHTELAKELTGLSLTPQGENYDLSGIPKDMEQRVASLRFTVSKDGVILGIRVEEVDGSTSSFTFAVSFPTHPSATPTSSSTRHPERISSTDFRQLNSTERPLDLSDSSVGRGAVSSFIDPIRIPSHQVSELPVTLQLNCDLLPPNRLVGTHAKLESMRGSHGEQSGSDVSDSVHARFKQAKRV